jgi:replicative superfamily II helicase
VAEGRSAVVDFAKLNAARGQTAPVDPLRIFQRLPKPPHINDLWESQSEALRLWTARRNQNDLVIKLNTGGGKTLVGLLIAQALLNELHFPVMYLCANNQLVLQTIQKGEEVQIDCVPYQSGPGDLPVEFVNGSAILVANYNAVFNGRSKFGVSGTGTEPVRVGGIICDDAHAAISTVRDAFTIAVSRRDQEELYRDLCIRFRTDFDKIGKLGSFDDILEREDADVLEVPYTAWSAKGEAIREFLAREHAEQFRYQLPFLRNYFHACHALLSARDFSITPIQPLVHLIPSFAECTRRIFMSATIADDSSIVRTFAANGDTVKDPIVPLTLAGVGERMILAPSLTKISNTTDRTVAQKAANAVASTAGAVVLVPSEFAASRWNGNARLMMGSDVESAVSVLVAGSDHGPFVFANRYDGIDLNGNACRLLVLDGLPRGANTYELFRSQILRGSSSLNISLAQKVEQGMGRATRGAGDYCVVLLVGPDLVAWITRNDTLALMTPSTRAQVLMGNEISRSVQSEAEFNTTMLQCLDRAAAWTKYHAETLADRAEKPAVNVTMIRAGMIERAYVFQLANKQFTAAAETVRRFAAEHHDDKRLRGWLLQLHARALHYAGDTVEAEKVQQEAFSSNPSLWAPPGMANLYKATLVVGGQVETILAQASIFAVPGGYLQDFEEAVSWLTPAASSNQFEEGLKRLGGFLGFHAERPEQEYGVGPDVLWLPDGSNGIVIEAKGGKNLDKPLGKSEHGQLLVSVEWFKKEYAGRQCIPVVVHPTTKATEPAMAQKAFALTFDKLSQLVAAVRAMLTSLCNSTVTKDARPTLCADLLRQHKLDSKQLVAEYLAPFEIA